MRQGRIDLKQLNQKRISVLVRDAANASRIVDYFGRHEYEIEVLTDASQLYSSLCEGGPPGFVFVSTQAEGPMAKMMPDFIVKRFRSPVFLFRESPDLPAVEPSAGILPPEIIPASNLEIDQLLEALETFDEVYNRRLREPSEPLFPLRDFGAGSAGPPESVSQFVRGGLPGEGSKSDEVFRLVKEAFVPGDVSVAEDDVLTLHACKVADPSGKGYFVFAFPVHAGESEPDEALVILESRVREAAGEGAVIENVVQAVPAGFFEDLRRRSDEVVSGRLGDREMILLYFRDREDVADPDIQVIGSNCLVPLEDWWTRLPMPCHTYLWMELNQRRVLYVRPGQCLRPEAYERFRRRGLRHLAVDSEDFAHYRKIREMVHMAAKNPAIARAAA